MEEKESKTMNWLGNLKVTGKIICLIVMAGLSLAAVGWNATSYLRGLQIDMNHMYTQNMQAVRYLSECSITVRAMQARILENTSLTDQKQLLKNKKNIEDYMSQYEEKWAAYEALGLKIDGSDDVNQHWQEFKESTNQMMELSVNGKQAEAAKLYGTKGIKEIIAWDNAMVPMRQIANDEAEKINNLNQDKVSSAVLSMSFITLIAMILMGLFGWMLSKAIKTPLNQMMLACERLRDGDFRIAALNSTRNDEFGHMELVVDEMRTSLNKFMVKTAESAEQIASASEELTASAQQSAQASQQVAESVTQASAAVSEQQKGVDDSSESVSKVANSVKDLQQEAGRVAGRAKDAFEQAVKGSHAIEQSVAQIKSVEITVGESAEIVDKLGERSHEIGQIVETISGIAEQTNLLALNAAIEAARAGEQGRGFSVVADEVRKLAEQSSEAAHQISALIADIQTDTANAVHSMKSGSDAVAEGAQSVSELRITFDNIRDYVDEVSKQVGDMAQAIQSVADDAHAIASHIEEIDAQGTAVSDEMQNVSAVSEEQSASANEIASASDSLARLAQDQQNELRKFKF